MKKISTALISVSDKRGIVDFAKNLRELGVAIISTGGTAEVLKNSHIQVKEVSSITDFPEILNGRVKTLHPKIFGGILADLTSNSHLDQMKMHGLSPISLVIVNLYPFVSTIQKKQHDLKDAIENIDIGGPSLIRAAAKNFKNVAVVTDPGDYSIIIEELEKQGIISENTRYKLAAKAFRLTAEYDKWISDYLSIYFDLKEDPLPERIHALFVKKDSLRYGENPHQRAAVYSASVSSIKDLSPFEQLNGKKLSFNNMMDLDSAWQIVTAFDDPAAVVVKHQNPCGVAVGRDIDTAYKRALACDPMSAYGGIVAVNKKIDIKVAESLHKTRFLEVIAAPDFTENAMELLKKKKNRRLLKISSALKMNRDIKWLGHMILVQSNDYFPEKDSDIKIVTEMKPSENQMEDLLFAWKVVRFVKSNAIVLARNKMTVGIGAGQMSRVDSVLIALRKAQENTNGAVLASDAFFPFSDSIEIAAQNGIKAIIQPGGSKRDNDVIDACDKLGIAMIFTGYRHFRH